jgi:hypothetical protein
VAAGLAHASRWLLSRLLSLPLSANPHPPRHYCPRKRQHPRLVEPRAAAAAAAVQQRSSAAAAAGAASPPPPAAAAAAPETAASWSWLSGLPATAVGGGQLPTRLPTMQQRGGKGDGRLCAPACAVPPLRLLSARCTPDAQRLEGSTRRCISSNEHCFLRTGRPSQRSDSLCEGAQRRLGVGATGTEPLAGCS